MEFSTVQDAYGFHHGHNDYFSRGLRHWQEQDLDKAQIYFRMADQSAERGDEQRNLYTSYHGLAMVHAGDLSGLNFCRQAAALETRLADVFYNLALVEFRLNHRYRGCVAVAKGLRLDSRHLGLLRLRREMGVRRKPVVGFLSRDNPINIMLGKVTYPLRKKAS